MEAGAGFFNISSADHLAYHAPFHETKAHMAEATFCNIYGQTEANSSTCYIIKEIPEDSRLRIPVGKDMLNFEVFLIGEDGL